MKWTTIYFCKSKQPNKYQGKYCAGCEAFVKESDLVDGKCPNHNKEPEINFDTVEGLNKVNEKLDREWKTHQTSIINKTSLNPDWKKNREVINNSNYIAIAA